MKSPHKLLLSLLVLVPAGRASALNSFDCLRDLIPVTDMAFIMKLRHGQEHPFMVSDFMVIPETGHGRVTGFYVYDAKNAWHYQNVTEWDGSNPRPLSSLSEGSVFHLMAQPKSLEVITIDFQPGFKPFAAKELYNPPEPGTPGKLLRLKGPQTSESPEVTMKPLLTELRLRESWIKNNNVDLESFKGINRVMQTTCQSSVDATESSPEPPQK